MKEKERNSATREDNSSTREDDAFLELCQQYAELARRDEDLAVSYGETEYEALERLDDREAERRILLWRILSEAERAGEPVMECIEEAEDEVAIERENAPAREAKGARKGAFIEQLGSFLRAPFRSANDRRLG